MAQKILYHYCSNFAFHSIITQKRVRLSLLSQSNDSKEGRHILDIARELLPSKHKEEILDHLNKHMELVSAVGFCLSQAGDVLSQWRGYADDAQGVAIGFNKNLLEAAAKHNTWRDIYVQLAPIIYDDATLIDIVSKDLEPIIDLFNSGRLKRPDAQTIACPMTEEQEVEKERYFKALSELYKLLFSIIEYSYSIKSNFFKEEEEFRIYAYFPPSNFKLNSNHWKIHPCHDKLRPYRDFPQAGFPPSMIEEIILGPRNKTPVEVVRLFLDSQGFEDVSIRRSGGSYC